MNSFASPASAPAVDPRAIGIARVYEWLTRRTADGHRTYERDARIVHCPDGQHADEHPSAKIHLTQHIFHCFSCGAGGGVLDMIIAAGVVDARLMQSPRAGAMRWLEAQVGIPHIEPLRGHAKPKPHQIRGKKLREEEQTATYFYVDADGGVCYRVVRIEGFDDSGVRAKRFEAHALRNGTWLRGMFGTPAIPFQLLAVLAAKARRAPLVLLEGERDAKLLTEFGFFSTSTPFGAGFTIRSDWHPYFAGLDDLIIIGDGDRAGRRAAERRKRELAPIVRNVRIVDPWPEHLEDGYDTTDLVRDLLAGDPDIDLADEIGRRFEINVCAQTALVRGDRADEYAPLPIPLDKSNTILPQAHLEVAGHGH